jgi:hypothetical protein
VASQIRILSDLIIRIRVLSYLASQICFWPLCPVRSRFVESGQSDCGLRVLVSQIRGLTDLASLICVLTNLASEIRVLKDLAIQIRVLPHLAR